MKISLEHKFNEKYNNLVKKSYLKMKHVLLKVNKYQEKNKIKKIK